MAIKHKCVTIRLSEQHLKKLNALSQHSGLSQVAVIRNMIDSEFDFLTLMEAQRNAANGEKQIRARVDEATGELYFEENQDIQ